MATINTEVMKELAALKECGVTVNRAVFESAKGDLSDYDNMGISELADLLIMLNG